MANLTIRYFSNCLCRHTTFQMYLPAGFKADTPDETNEYTKRETKTLFLLHGYTGDAGNWVPEYLADKYNFAIVIPTGENGFWLDGLSTGHKFGSMLGEELIGYVRKVFGLAMRKEDTYIMGMSMGGFGAIHTALYYPEVFGTAAGLSSALIVRQVASMKEGDENPMANYAYYRECFGDLSKVLESDNNPETLVKKIKAEGKEMPRLLVCCGTEDFLIENNREFHRFLETEGVDHIYNESKGQHDMDYWNEYVQKYVPIMFG